MSQRETSVGGSGTIRRGPLKEHAPFRADDLARGKRTGNPIPEVPKDSDDLENFEDVLDKASNATPKRKSVGKRRKAQSSGKRVGGSNGRSNVVDSYVESEDGSEPMDLDEESPAAALSQPSRKPSAPPSDHRVGSASSKVLRRPDTDFDSIPEPRQRSRPTQRNNDSIRTEDASHAGTSLGNHVISSDALEYDNSQDNNNSGDVTVGMSFTGVDDDMNEGSDSDKENRRFVGGKTTVGGAEDREEFEEAMKDIEDRSDGIMETNTNKHYDRDDDGRESDEEESGEKRPTPKPKSKPETKTKKAPKPKPAVRKQILKNDDDSEDDSDNSGLRRGKRQRYAPLEWWRCEKVVYGRRDSGRQVVPVIKAVIRYPKEEAKPLSKKASRPRRRQQQQQRQHSAEVLDPEAGWDDDTESHGIVLDFQSGEPIQRRLVYTAAMVDPVPAAKNAFRFQKIFGDGEFIAAGQLVIPPNGSKPPKTTKDNSYIFYLIEGAIQLKIHDTSYVLCSGSMFLVPRGNMYFLENVGERDARLFFAQARKIPLEEMEPDAQPTSRRTASSAPGSSQR